MRAGPVRFQRAELYLLRLPSRHLRAALPLVRAAEAAGSIANSDVDESL